MTSFRVHSIDTAPEGSRDTLRRVHSMLGGIPNLAATMAESPVLLNGFFALRDIYTRGSFTSAEIEVLSLTNAFEHSCSWCMAFHSGIALKGGVSRESVEELRNGRAPVEPRLKALSDFSRSMVRNRGLVGSQDLAAFRAAGFSDAQALEVVVGVAFSVMANFADHLAHAPLDEAWKPFEWHRPDAAESARRVRV